MSDLKKIINEDVTIPTELTQQYLNVKKQISDKMSQKDALMKQVTQKETEINILNKNLIAIEAKAAQMQGKDAQVKSGEVAKAENKTADSKSETTSPTSESYNIMGLLKELNEMDQSWIFEDEEIKELEPEVIDKDDEEQKEELEGESDYVFAIRLEDIDEDEEIIAKIYRNEEDSFWRIRVVQGSEEPLETMQFDPDMEIEDIIEKISEIPGYNDVEELPMDEYKELLDDKKENDKKYSYKELNFSDDVEV